MFDLMCLATYVQCSNINPTQNNTTALIFEIMFRITNIALAIALMSASTSAFAPSTYGVSRGVASNTNVVAASTPVFNTNSMQLFMSEDAAVPSKIVRKADSNVEITLVASGAATQAAYDKACAEVSKTMSIPGFRKGAKIPSAIIENAMAAKGGKNALKTQTIQTVLNQLLEPAMKEEHNLEPIGQPSLVTSADEMAETFKPGDPLEMVVSCDVWPDIAWMKVEGQDKPYFGLKAAYSRKNFNQPRFEQAMKDLAERYAVTAPAPEGKALAMGDSCIVDMKGFMAAEDGTSKAEPLPDAASGDDVEIVLGDGRYMEGLVDGLVGAEVGQTKTVYVSFPVGLRDKTLAGKKAVFDVTVKEANTRTVPEIDDELAEQIRPGLDAKGLKDEVSVLQ
jgi:trigger factor